MLASFSCTPVAILIPSSFSCNHHADATEHRSWFAWGTSAISTFLTPSSLSSSTATHQKGGAASAAALGAGDTTAPPAVAPGEEDLQELLELLQAGQEQVIVQQPDQGGGGGGGGVEDGKGSLLVSFEMQVRAGSRVHVTCLWVRGTVLAIGINAIKHRLHCQCNCSW